MLSLVLVPLLCLFLLYTPSTTAQPLSLNVSSSFSSPYGLAYDGAGHLYVSDLQTGLVTELTTDGARVASFALTPTPTITGLAVDSQGFLYAVSTTNSQVLKVASNGSVVQTFTASNPSLLHPYGVAIDASGHLFVADTGNQRVVQLNATGAVVASFTSTTSVMPYGIAVDPSSQALYVADPFHSQVLRASLAAPYTLQPFYSAGLSHPYDVVVDAAGAVYISDASNFRVVRVSPAGALLQLLTASSPSLDEPIGLALDLQRGVLYVADYYNGRVVSLSLNAGASSSSTGGSSHLVSGSLCGLMYGLEGNVDYPWSVATTLSFLYDPTPVSAASGTAVTVVSGSGVRTFTNRFGDSFSTPLTINAPSTGGGLLYLNSAFPVDNTGLTMTLASPVQLPGAGPTALYSTLRLYNSSSGAVVEDGSSRVDALGEAFLASVPGFLNASIRASNVNSFAANYAQCQAPLTFSNGLEQPTQPSTSNGALHSSYAYTIGDGLTYSVHTALVLTTSSAFASTKDQLGSPYQTVVNITGTRIYTHIPTNVTVISQVGFNASSAGTVRFYPYSLLASKPGVYSVNTAPFIDAVGLALTVSPAVPSDGAAPGVGSQSASIRVRMAGDNNNGPVLLTEVPSINLPLASLQQQTYTLLS